ncbi:MAG: spermidine/putrescine transport system substrate-binding protein [Rhodobacteraceae bacterium HLUCCO07]|nr:MAG: spermidine/putrescine transport system substrate-binding protein [Rhodobacteraceae bacterium HLUCCO07]
MTRTFTRLATHAAIAGLAAGAAMADGSDLTVFDWSGYEDPGFYGNYVETYGEGPSYSYFGDEDEAFAKLQSGFSADLSHPCSYVTQKWADAGLLQPIDTSRLDYWDDLLPGISSVDGIDFGGETWMVPFDWGNTGLIYRSDEFSSEEVSLQMLTDPAYKNKISLPGGALEAVTLGVLATGAQDSYPDLSEEEFQAVLDFLRDVHENVRFYWSDATQLDQALASGEVLMGWGWNQTEVNLISNGVPAEMMRDVEKGVVSWVCGYVHMQDSDVPDEQVYDMLNALTAPESGKYIIESWGYAHSNARAFDMADPELVEAYGYSDPDTFFAGSLFGVPLDPALERRLREEYERIKSGF